MRMRSKLLSFFIQNPNSTFTIKKILISKHALSEEALVRKIFLEVDRLSVSNQRLMLIATRTPDLQLNTNNSLPLYHIITCEYT